MKNLFTYLIVAFIAFSSMQASGALAVSSSLIVESDDDLAQLTESARMAETNAQWRRFSVNLVHALRSSREGVQEAAMRYVIQYAENVDVSEAAIDVMRIYRNDADINKRRMAVVTLGSMKNQWALRFLERSAQFEKSEMVVQTILAVLAQEKS